MIYIGRKKKERERKTLGWNDKYSVGMRKKKFHTTLYKRHPSNSKVKAKLYTNLDEESEVARNLLLKLRTF